MKLPLATLTSLCVSALSLASNAVTTLEPQQIFHAFAATANSAVTITPKMINSGSAFGLSKVTEVSQGSFGTVTLRADGSIVYKPNLSFPGTDTFTFTATSYSQQTATGSIVVNDFAFCRGSYGTEITYKDPYSFRVEIGDPTVPETGGIISITGTGTFTLHIGALAFSGTFDSTGEFTRYLDPYLSSLMSLDLAVQGGAPVLSGLYRWGISKFEEEPSGYLTGYKIAPSGDRHGRYSVLLQPTSSTGPQGTGWATMTLTPGGLIRFAGQLNDGRAISLSSSLKADSTFPVSLGDYAHHSVEFDYSYRLHGSATFRNIEGVSDFDGTLEYRRSRSMASHPAPGATYPDGFDVNLNFIGSRFTPPAPHQLILKFTSTPATATLGFTGGDLTSDVSSTIKITPTSIISKTPPVTQFTIYQQDSPNYGAVGGIFSGHFTHPGVNATRSFIGVVFQKQNLGAGFFRGDAAAGTVTFTPQ